MQRRSNFEDKNLMQRGFSLVELLVVIVILGILAAVVVFAVTGITSKGQSTSACSVEVRTVNTALQAFNAKSATNSFPTGTIVAGATGMFGQLKTAGVIQQTAPGATANYSPTYDGAGNYTATCPQ